MRRLILPTAILFLAVWMACSPRTTPTVTTAPVAPAPETIENVKEAAADKEIEATLAAGKVIYTGKCTRCHTAKPVDNWTADEWKPILKSMVRKTKLDSIETAQVTAYVNANCRK